MGHAVIGDNNDDADHRVAGEVLAIARARAIKRLRERLDAEDDELLDDALVAIAVKFNLLVRLEFNSVAEPNSRPARRRGVVDDREIARRVRRGELVKLTFADKIKKTRAVITRPGRDRDLCERPRCKAE
jgi:hypothetical protein